MDVLLQLLPAWWAYILITASPGPSNMAIMNLSMEQGRRPALALACGIIAGSQCWGILAAMSVSSLIVSHPAYLRLLGVIGGGYFLWLGYKFLRTAFVNSRATAGTTTVRASFWRLFVRGFSLHIVNPKAILGWVSIIAIAVAGKPQPYVAFLVIIGCLILGGIIFGGYAIAFSAPKMSGLYGRQRKYINIVVGCVFLFAGGGLLLNGL